MSERTLRYRRYPLPTRLDAGLASVDGERVEMTSRGLLPEAVRDKARLALESGEPLRMTIRAFGGAVSKPVRLTDAYRQSLASVAGGMPLLNRVHEGSLLSLIRKPEVEGVIEAARATDDGGLDEDIAVYGREALTELSMGVAPAYSIQFSGGSVTCSACGAALTGGWGHATEDGYHELGATLDGERIEAVYDGAGRLVETTRTYTPAADGTYVSSVQLSADLLDQIPSDLLDTLGDALAGLRTRRARAQEDPMAETTTPAAQAATVTPEERIRQLEAERDAAQLQAELAERTASAQLEAAEARLSTLEAAHQRTLAAEAKRTVLDLTPHKVQPAAVERHIALCLSMGADEYRALMATVQGDPALRLGRRTGTTPDAPEEGLDSPTLMAQRLSELRSAHPNKSADELWQLAAAAVTH
jgi:hypothetical protein